MNCEQCRASMVEIWSGSLPPEDRAAAELHLADCRQCKSEVDRLRTLWDTLGSMPPEDPGPDFRSRFYGRLDAYRQGMGEWQGPGARRSNPRAPGSRSQPPPRWPPWPSFPASGSMAAKTAAKYRNSATRWEI